MKNNIKDALLVGSIIGAVYMAYSYFSEGYVDLTDPVGCAIQGFFIALGGGIIGIILYPLVWILLWIVRRYGWQGFEYPEKERTK